MDALVINQGMSHIKPSNTQTPYWFQAIRMERLLNEVYSIHIAGEGGNTDEFEQRIENGTLAEPGIEYIRGDATEPVGHYDDLQVIVHCCNNIGAWGAGFVIPLGTRYPAARDQYLYWAKNEQTVLDVPFELGAIQMVWVEHRIWVCNLIGQDGVGKKKGVPPIRYEAIQQGLQSLSEWIGDRQASVHMPRMGCGLAGGDWETMAGIIQSTIVQSGHPVIVYDV